MPLHQVMPDVNRVLDHMQQFSEVSDDTVHDVCVSRELIYVRAI